MRDIFQGSRRTKLIDWLKIDSWIDSGLYNSWIGFRDWWSAYSSFFGKFEVKGFVRALNELACEALTLSVGGLLVVTAFALPAFEIAQGKINLSDEYSVTFLDRYGNEIGKRGLLRDDSVPLEEIPDFMIKATLATEDRRFFEHFGVDVMGTFRALAANAQHDTVVQGGSSLTQQLAKNMFLSPERSLSRKIKEAFIAIYLENHYTKPEILKLYFDRAYLGGGSYGVEAAAQYLFRQVDPRGEPRRSRYARRHVQGAHALCPARQPRRLTRPRQRGAEQHGRGRLHERRPSLWRPHESRQRSSSAPTPTRLTTSSIGPSRRCSG